MEVYEELARLIERENNKEVFQDAGQANFEVSGRVRNLLNR